MVGSPISGILMSCSDLALGMSRTSGRGRKQHLVDMNYNPYTDEMNSYTVYCMHMHSGEEFDFTMEAYSRAEVLAVCEEDFGSNVKVNYIMNN